MYCALKAAEEISLLAADTLKLSKTVQPALVSAGPHENTTGTHCYIVLDLKEEGKAVCSIYTESS